MSAYRLEYLNQLPPRDTAISVYYTLNQLAAQIFTIFNSQKYREVYSFTFLESKLELNENLLMNYSPFNESNFTEKVHQYYDSVQIACSLLSNLEDSPRDYNSKVLKDDDIHKDLNTVKSFETYCKALLGTPDHLFIKLIVLDQYVRSLYNYTNFTVEGDQNKDHFRAYFFGRRVYELIDASHKEPVYSQIAEELRYCVNLAESKINGLSNQYRELVEKATKVMSEIEVELLIRGY